MKATDTQITWNHSPTAGHDKHGQSAVYDEATGKDIAIVYDGKAHGDLLAAAPELLQALERILEQIDDTGTVNAYEGQRAKAAIAKARGE